MHTLAISSSCIHWFKVKTCCIVISHQHPIHPASGNDGVQSADDDVELWTKKTQVSAVRILLYELCQCIDHAAQTLTPVERLIQVLDLFKVAVCFVLRSLKKNPHV